MDTILFFLGKDKINRTTDDKNHLKMKKQDKEILKIE